MQVRDACFVSYELADRRPCNSSCRDRVHLGEILYGYYPRELQSRRGTYDDNCSLLPALNPLLQVNFFVGASGVTQLYRIWE